MVMPSTRNEWLVAIKKMLQDIRAMHGKTRKIEKEMRNKRWARA
jgi:hypothetical protein